MLPFNDLLTHSFVVNSEYGKINLCVRNGKISLLTQKGAIVCLNKGRILNIQVPSSEINISS